MKGSRLLGILAAVLAVLCLATGVLSADMENRGGPLAEMRNAAAAREEIIAGYTKAAEKSAPSAIKKANSAITAADKAAEQSAAAVLAMEELLGSITADGKTGDELVDSLNAALAGAREGVPGAQAAFGSLEAALKDNAALTDAVTSLRDALALTVDSVADTGALADGLVNRLFTTLLSGATKGVSDAEEKIGTALTSVSEVYSSVGATSALTPVSVTAFAECVTPEDCLARARECAVRAAELQSMSADVLADANAAQAEASAVSQADGRRFSDRAILFLDANWMGFLFTFVLLLAAALVLLIAPNRFAGAWRRNPVFSTAIALLVMVAIQTYALGFQFESVGAWLSYWFNNAMNVLRANSSVGMIALGMTFVIISGGIDLAVGSTLAGISTVVMCLIDVSQKGPLTSAGISGMPAYLIACAAGMLLGLALGGVTGAVVTKGHVPPFIVTLGMMQIVRSVAQYFTKSYTPDVPKAFQALANTSVGGQMLLPIVYWIVLAAIMYVVSRRTVFGRHVYAVGSNERTTMLSGINTDNVKMKVYVLMGFIVSLAAICQVARLRGVDVASAGNGYEMNAIAAVIVGGTSMAGGRGSILGTVLGVLIIGIMNNLLVLLSVDSFLSNAFTGAIVVAAVLMQRKEKNS